MIYCTKVHEIFTRCLGVGIGFAIFQNVVKCQHKQ